jgi:hypothetical protein
VPGPKKDKSSLTLKAIPIRFADLANSLFVEWLRSNGRRIPEKMDLDSAVIEAEKSVARRPKGSEVSDANQKG